MNINLREYIKRNEGLRTKPYKCSAEKLTIGYGRNLDDKGINEYEAELMFGRDLNEAIEDVKSVIENFESLTKNRQIVLVDMVFNLGIVRFSKFKNMIREIHGENWNTAAYEIKNSAYYKQVPNRAKRNIELMIGG